MSGSTANVALPGRSAEAAAIDDLLERAQAGRGRSLLLTGEPGIGKTRLIEHAVEAAERAGMRVARGACFEDAAGTPFAPFQDLLRDISRELDAGLLGRRAPERVGDSATGGGFTTVERRERLFDEVVSLIRDESERAPLLIAIDDAQWADEASLLLLRRLIRSARTMALAILVAARDTEPAVNATLDRLRTDMRRERTGLSSALRRLTADETSALVAQFLGAGSEDILSALVEAIHRESEGVPLFAEEWVSYLRDERLLRRSGSGTWTFDAARPVGAPWMVRGVIEERLGRLEPATRAWLDALAVGGSSANRELLAAVGDLWAADDGELDAALEEARSRGLVEDAPVIGFSHHQFRQAILSHMDASRRRDLHRAVANALERTSPDLGRDAATLAHHFRQAGDLRRAYDYTRRAAGHARERMALEEAARHAQEALALLDVAPDDFGDAPQVAKERSALLLDIEVAQEQVGDVAGRRASLARLRREIDAAGDPGAAFQLALRESGLGVDVGDEALARDAARRALELAGDERQRIDALLAQVEAATGRRVGDPAPFADDHIDVAAAEQALEQAAAIARTAGDTLALARIEQESGVVLWGRERPDDSERVARARDLLESALRGYRAAGDRKGEVTALIALAYRRPTPAADSASSFVDSYVSFLEEIRRLRATEHRLTRGSERPRSEALSLLSIHLYCRTTGWLEPALDRGAKALEWASEARDERVATIAQVGLAETERLLGRGARALRHAEAARATLDQPADEGGLLEGLRDSVLETLAACHVAAGIGERALDLARERVSRAAEAAQPAVLANALAGQAETLLAVGQRDHAAGAAREALRVATGLSGNITADIRAELALARVALEEGDARLALGYSAAAAGKIAQRDTPLAMLRLEARLVHGLALEASELADDSREEIRAAHDIVQRVANRIADGPLRQTFLARSALAVETQSAVRRLGLEEDEGSEATRNATPGGLTRRELEVLRLVASGMNNRDIANRLFISEKTVARHLTNTFTKIDAVSRTQAAAWAYRNGIV